MDKWQLKRLLYNKGFLLVVTLLLNSVSASSQNLVVNSSFEDTIRCWAFSPIYSTVLNWKSRSITLHSDACLLSLKCRYNSSGTSFFPYTPTYGFQLPRTGTNIAWTRQTQFVPIEYRDWVDYLQTELLDTVKIGKKYFVGLFVARTQEITYAIRNIGIYLGSDTLEQFKDSNMIMVTPQVESNVLLEDTVNWMLIADTITAGGNEKYLTAGRFTDFALTDTTRIFCNYPPSLGQREGAVYYLDDIFVIPLDSLSTPTYGINSGLQYDASYCSMDYATVSVKESFPLVKYTWYNSAMQVIDSLNPSIHPRLTQSETFYLKRQNPAGQIRWDTAYVTIATSGCLNTLKDVIQNKALFYPNPTTGEFSLLLNNEQLSQINEINIYNSTGQNVKKLNKETTQNISELPAGVYTLQIKTNKGEVFNTKLVKW